ncbi:hypothetical protein JCM16814_33610 [Desulfobaculum senezii]
MTGRYRLVCTLVAALVLLPVLAMAAGQEGDERQTTFGAAVGPLDREPFAVEAFGGVIGAGDVEDTDGDVSVTSAGVVLQYGNFGLKYNGASYDWGNVDDLPFGSGDEDPWDALHSLSLTYRHVAYREGEVTWMVSGSLLSGFEEEMDSSVSAGLSTIVRYAFDDDWSAGIGAAVQVEPIGIRAFPGLVVLYRSARQEGLSAMLGMPTSTVAYRFSPQWAVKAQASMSGGLYRLADDSSVREKGYVRVSGVASGLYAEWTPTPRVRVTAGPEYHFGRGYTFYDDDGDEKDTYDVDASLGASLKVWVTF